MGNALQFNWKSNLTKNIERLRNRCDAAVKMYATTKAAQLEAYMKLRRPWTDRTGAAKARLSGRVAENPGRHTIEIILAHGVNYGVWLELAHEKNFAIIGPTINLKSQEVIDGLQMLLFKMAAAAGVEGEVNVV